MFKMLVLVFFFQSTVFALNLTPQQKAFQMMQINNQIMLIEQTIQYKTTEKLNLQTELKEINKDQNLVADIKSTQNSIRMRMQKIKVSGNLLRIENEIKELNQNKQQIINQQKMIM